MAAWRQISIGPPPGGLRPAYPTLRVTPVVDGGRVVGDLRLRHRQTRRLTGTLQGSLEKWLESLRDTVAAGPRGPLLAANIPDRGGLGPIRAYFLKNRLFGLIRTVCLLLHSWAAFGIALPLPASDRRHLGCGCSSVVEHDLAKVGVEGSSPFARSRFFPAAQALLRSVGPIANAGGARGQTIIEI
jgi:hypothetical protein